MGLFIKKPLEALQAEANQTGSKSLKRVLGPWSLVALGVGVIIGAGLFSITGTVAAGYTGPAITLSFAIAAIGCCFAGLCYAEFASMIPVAGSAYTYSYATMGELIAWIIGWDFGRDRNQPSDSFHRLPLGWRDCQYPGIPDRCPDEYLSDPRDGREFYL